MKLCCVYDRVADVWQPPIAVHSDREAVRGFSLSCINEAVPKNYLGDISLYVVGEFDELTGAVTSMRPELLIHGDDYTILSRRNPSKEEDLE